MQKVKLRGVKIAHRMSIMGPKIVASQPRLAVCFKNTLPTIHIICQIKKFSKPACISAFSVSLLLCVFLIFVFLELDLLFLNIFDVKSCNS